MHLEHVDVSVAGATALGAGVSACGADCGCSATVERGVGVFVGDSDAVGATEGAGGLAAGAAAVFGFPPGLSKDVF